MKPVIFSILALFSSVLLIGQVDDDALLAHLPFENQDASDVVNRGSGTSVAVNGSPSFTCGVIGDAIQMSDDDFLVLNGTVNNVFGSSNFTMSFYFKPTNFGATQDIISKRQACTTQRAFAVRYMPLSQSLDITIAENATKETNTVLPLPRGRCWYHLAIVKSNRTTIIYINGREEFRDNAVARIDLDNPESLAFSNGPCLGVTDQRFQGLIDDFRVYDRALSRESVRTLYVEPDAVASRDTLIFLGGSVPLRIGNTCASMINWKPSLDIDNPNSSNAVFNPMTEGTYNIFAEFDDGNCIASDTIRVVVVDPANLDCDEIYLPNAFTPNGDGVNDIFGVDNPFAIERLINFEIFDRLGNLLYTSTDIFSKWDGKYKGQTVNPGVYVYRVEFECRGEDKSRLGSFTVLK